MGLQDMTQPQQLFTVSLVVIDLAVECDGDRSVPVVQGLMATRQVDDAQPDMGQSHGTLVHDTEAGSVGATMPDRGGHPAQVTDIDPRAIELLDRTDSAH